MKVVQYNNPYTTSNIDNIRGSGCVSDNYINPPSHTESPRVTNRKCSIHSRYNTQNYNDRFKKTTPITYKHLNDLSHTKSRIFPERYIHKYDVSYRTTNTDEYNHPKIKEKFEKLQISSLNAYSSSDEPKKCFVKHNSLKNSNQTRELSKEKPLLVGKVYSTPLNNNSQVTNKTNFDDWNNPNKHNSSLKSL